jgi:tetratricopeptide (TPR) repeat protein
MKDNLDAIVRVNLGTCYLFLAKEKEALRYYQNYISGNKVNEKPAQLLYRYIGYTYWQNGYRKEANYYFKRTLEKNNSLVKYSLPVDYYDLAGVYAFMGEKDKAYDNLKNYSQKEFFTSIEIAYLKNDPLFNSIRNEPRFRMIVRNAEAKFQAEHERVKKWMVEQGKL